MEFPNILIRASAGTGKTFQLSNRYINLLLASHDPASILATTFTRKAAGEILERIFLRLAKAALTEQGARELSNELGHPAISSPRFGETLKELATNLHRLHVGTLDSYFSQLLSNYAFEYHLGTDWRIMTGVEITQSKTTALAAMVDSADHTKIARLMHLIHKGRHKRSVFREIDHTLTDLLEPFYQTNETAWLSTFSRALLNKKQLQQATANLEAKLDSADSEPFLAKVQSDIARIRGEMWDTLLGTGLFKKIAAGENIFNRKEIPLELIDAYTPLVNHVAGLKAKEIQHQTEATRDLLLQFTEHLDQFKLANNRLEFSDVARMLTATNIDHDASYRMDVKIEHMLLDEFQDTSVSQWNVLEPLANTLTKSHPPSNSFFCVGDVKQAIYGWRGGRREIFDRLSASMEKLENDDLSESYRASPVIIEFINLVFSNLTNHPNMSGHQSTIKKWQDDFITHQAHYDFPGFVQYVNAESHRTKGKRDEYCLKLAVDKVEELISSKRDIQIGILVRDNESIANLIQMLGTRGIPASEEGGNPLSRYSSIQLVLSVLKLVDHPGDTIAAYHVSRSPLASHLGLTDYQNQLEISRLTGKIRADVGRFGFPAFIYQLICELESHVDFRQFERLLQLSRFADQYQFIQPLRVREFISAVENERFADPLSSRVRVMNIHQSKGLEFDAVILPTLGSSLTGSSPQYALSRNEKTQEIEHVYTYRSSQIQKLMPDLYRNACEAAVAERVSESLCVLYVAITRASRAIYLIGPCQDNPPRSVPLTSAGIVQSAATGQYCQTANQIVYETGDPHWIQSCRLLKDAQPSAPAFLPAPFGVMDPNANVLVPSASPSSLEGGPHLKLSAVLRPRSEKALSTGTELHFFMEQIDWFTPEIWDNASGLFTSRFGDIRSPLAEHLASMNRGGELNRFLIPSFYTEDKTSPIYGHVFSAAADNMHMEVLQEYPICALVDGHLVRGYIDRLILFSKDDEIIAADIVDFKTDSVGSDPDILDRRILHYQPQIFAYRKAISQMHRLSQAAIGSRLLFTDPAKQAVIPSPS